jgi:hypothetical protein
MPTVPRPHEDHPEVVTAVAETLRHRREEGIPEAELVAVADREGVWPYQIMEALGLSNQGGVFLPKPPKVVVEEEESVESTRIEWTSARLGPPIPPADSSPGRAETMARAWSQRLQAILQGEGEVVVTLEEMVSHGWPPSAGKHPTFWSTSHEAGRVARELGWTPRLRDGVGVVFRRTA